MPRTTPIEIDDAPLLSEALLAVQLPPKRRGRTKSSVFGASAMMLLSATTFAFLWTLQCASNSSLDKPISLEIHSGNPLALASIGLLCAVIAVFARRLVNNGHTIRTSFLRLSMAGLVLIVLTDPSSQFHDVLVGIVSLFSILWMVVMAVDYNSRDIAYSAIGAITVLPVMSMINTGLAERGLITYFLWIMNVLYYAHMSPKGRRWD